MRPILDSIIYHNVIEKVNLTKFDKTKNMQSVLVKSVKVYLMLILNTNISDLFMAFCFHLNKFRGVTIYHLSVDFTDDVIDTKSSDLTLVGARPGASS